MYRVGINHERIE